MHISITGRHHEVSPVLRAYATEKLERLGRFSRKLDEIHLILWPERYQLVAEITVHDKQFRAVATAQAPQEQAAFDLALEKIEGHLRRHKERVAEHPHRRGPEAAR
jgi:putative sigma-54 modulation protein